MATLVSHHLLMIIMPNTKVSHKGFAALAGVQCDTETDTKHQRWPLLRTAKSYHVF